MANSPTQSGPIHGAIDNEVAQDAQLELRRRARRRLIGASALALLAVVVLPMVMDHEPRLPAQDIQVRIPSQDSAGTTGGIVSRILPGRAPTPLPPAAESTPKPVIAAAPAEPTAATKSAPAPEPKAEARVESKPAPRTEAKAALPKPEPKAPPTQPDKKAADANKSAEKDKAAEGARAEAALSGVTPAAAGAEQWVVQLGAYKDAANVKQLTARLKGMGVPSYTEKFDSPQGPRTRVRAGPFPTKEAAEKAQAKAKAIGVNGPVAPK